MWALQLVTLVKKKNGKLTMKVFRTIAMLPTKCRLYSKVLHQLAGQAIHSWYGPQYGHVPDRQTYEVVFILRRMVEQANEWRIPIFVMDCDVAAAFDHVSHHLIIDAMEALNVPPVLMAAWIREYRSSRCRIGEHSACFQRNFRSLGVSHRRYTLHGHAEAVGPLKGPLNVMFKKERSYSIKTGSPKKLQTVSVLSQSSRLVSLQSKTTESPATSPCSHHMQTERVDEYTTFYAAASSNRALPTPSCLSERYFFHSGTWHQNKGQADHTHDTSTDTLGWIMFAPRSCCFFV